jgi:aminoglycoside phosphotransferase (APT) family kinase protein
LLPSAHAIECEYRAMHALAGTAVLVPRIVFRCEDAAVIGTSLGLDLAVHGILPQQEFMQAYCQAAVREMPAQMDVFIVVSLFRLAAILAGLYRRALDGNASDARAGAGRGVRPGCRAGLDFGATLHNVVAPRATAHTRMAPR